MIFLVKNLVLFISHYPHKLKNIVLKKNTPYSSRSDQLIKNNNEILVIQYLFIDITNAYPLNNYNFHFLINRLAQYGQRNRQMRNVNKENTTSQFVQLQQLNHFGITNCRNLSVISSVTVDRKLSGVSSISTVCRTFSFSFVYDLCKIDCVICS